MALTPLKMNLDYEASLFEGKSSDKINHALEYLAFYLSPGPFASSARYEESFLQKVEKLSGEKPLITNTKNFENNWGVGVDVALEKELNSKLLSARLTQTIAPQEGVVVMGAREDLPQNFPFPAICKLPQSMSGKGVRKISQSSELTAFPFPYVLEPLRKRVMDFSHFIYPSGEVISYENRVDENFQYRGSIFHKMNQPNLVSIPGLQKISFEKRKRFETELASYRNEYEKLANSAPLSFGYSIDSFVYEEQGELQIRTCSEFNFRKTMGMLAYELGKKLVPDCPWVALRLFFPKKGQGDFQSFMKEMESSGKLLILSPKEARIQVLLVATMGPEEGEMILSHADRFDVHKLPDSKL